MACHLRVIEARTVRTPVGVIARRAVSAEAVITGAAVQARSIVVAHGIGVRTYWGPHTRHCADSVCWTKPRLESKSGASSGARAYRVASTSVISVLT